MHRMGVLAMLFNADDGIKYDRCVRMAIVHDLAEAIVGDITPHCGVADDEKERREREAMLVFKTWLAETPEAGAEVVDLWEEYEAQATPESHVVKDLDKFEMILQAYEYERDQQRHPDLQPFYDGALAKLKNPRIKSWASELMSHRAKLAAAQAAAELNVGTKTSDKPT
eukprot:m.66089 g.66089  ORF g.66089 m.66089 type:complete len:169 (-) comp13711_c0_seq2:202-708(-)